MRSLALPEAPTPRVLGVDDCAKRKGQSYGTILVDHERECAIELLTDRTPETFAKWLREHPGVEIVTRDRAEAYAQGIRDGAPKALQVADRWHLLKNLAEAVTKILHDHQRSIQQQFRQMWSAAGTVNAVHSSEPSAKTAESQVIPATSDTAQPSAIDATASPMTLPDQLGRQRAAEAHALRRQGWTMKSDRESLGLPPKTIRRYLQRQLPPTPRLAARSTKLDDFKT